MKLYNDSNKPLNRRLLYAAKFWNDRYRGEFTEEQLNEAEFTCIRCGNELDFRTRICNSCGHKQK